MERPSIAKNSYSWADCVDLTEKNNPDVRAAKASYEAAVAEANGARSNFFPQISSNLELNKTNASSTSKSTSSDSTATTYNANLTGTQNLFHGFQDWYKTSQLEETAKAAEENLNIVRAKTSFELKSAFYGLIYADRFLVLNQDIVKRRSENERLVQLRFESGRENKGSLLLAKAYHEDAQLGDLQAKHSVTQARTKLAQVMGIEEFYEFTVKDAPKIPDAIEAEPAYDKLLLETPEYRQALAKENASHYALKVAQSGFYPELNMNGTWGKQGPDFFPENKKWNLGVILSLPLFNGFKDYYSTKGASSTLLASESNRFAIGLQMAAKLRSTYNAFEEAIRKVRVDASFRDAANIRSQIAKSKYNNGLLTFDDWDVIEADLIVRQKSYLQSVRDQAVAEAAWQQAQGKGVLQ